ncbi:hypothetical protein [Streptomyces sp. NPDC046870]|uniref:hypothetical protein n=1 Tax=Streptomyces sp. NPDC046870 TaxID=3155135 RepID=UPI00345371E5
MFLLPAIDPDPSENRVWNASLDGRAIHSYLLWIEPTAADRAPRAAVRAPAAPGAVPPGPDHVVTPLDRALTALVALAEAAPARVALDRFDRSRASLRLGGTADDGPQVLVLETPADEPRAPGLPRTLLAAGPAAREATTAAAAVLDEVGLRYVLDLALGAVVYASEPHPRPYSDGSCELAWIVGRPDDPVAVAEALLREGARAWTGQWLRAEESVGMRTAPLRHPDRDWLAGLLGDCFAYQLHDRLAGRHGGRPGPARERADALYAALLVQRPGLDERLGRTAGFGVLCELVAFMYPCWNRRQFATKSPFDYMRELRAVTDAEKAQHLAKWSVPEAAR